jgi:uncharacterized membrane protein
MKTALFIYLFLLLILFRQKPELIHDVDNRAYLAVVIVSVAIVSFYLTNVKIVFK